MTNSNSNLPNNSYSDTRPFARVSESLLRFLRISNGKVATSGSAPAGCNAIELEARVLYSGSPLPADLIANTELIDAVADLDVEQIDNNHVTVPESPFQTDIHELLQSATDSFFTQNNPSTNPTATELIFVDAGVQRLESLLDDIQANYAQSTQVKIVLIEAGNGIQQITDTLNQHRDIRSVHIVSHGNDGSVQLGNTSLTNSTLAGYAGSIASWSEALLADADILFYGCNLAATADGQELVDSLAELTSADVAASDDLTGHESLDGDWELEYVFGDLQTEVFVSATFQSNWRFSLASITVDTTADYASSSANWGDTSSIAALLADKGADNLVTLREAIEASNNTPTAGTPNQILFNIADDTLGQYYYANDFVSGSVSDGDVTAVPIGGEASITDFDPDHPYSWFRIDLAPVGGELNITESVIIDGYSQWGASENTLAVGSDAVVRIEVTNTSADGNRGFHFEDGSDGTTIQGLAINRFGAAAILTDLGADGNTFRGNHIGTDVTGTIGQGNQEGIHLRSAGNVIGGADVSDRNVLSDNNSRGVITFTFSSTIVHGNVVQNNYIGVDASGMVQLGNGGSGGIQVYNQDGMQILDNVISGNSGDGITFLAGGDAFNAVVQGNYIGVAADGATIVQNGGNGIEIASDLATGNLIGGTSAGQGNIIAGNVLSGIELDGAGVTGTTIVGNFIGTDATGLIDLGNGDYGVLIDNGASNNAIGGTTAGARNVIAFNDKDGVNIKDNASVRNSILGNSIYSNDELGIDLEGGGGVTDNDDFDTDNGPNERQNFPVITTAATDGGGNVVINGFLATNPGTYRVEFFANSVADPSGHGEGQTYIGFADLTVDASGAASFILTLPSTVTVGEVISATATDSSGNTSEFGFAATVTALPTPDNSGIWLSTVNDVTGSGITELPNWDDDEVIGLGGSPFELESGGTDGQFSSVFNLDIFTDDNVNIDGIHYVTQSVTIGSGPNELVVQAGDVLLSTTNAATFFGGAFAVESEDVFLFRPDAVGNYSSGKFIMVLDLDSPAITDPILTGLNDLRGLTLVEQDVTIGGQDLFAGEILFSRNGGAVQQDIYVLHVTDTGAGVTNGTADLLIDGTALGYNNRISGLDIVETSIVVGDESLSSGTLLISVNQDTTLLDADLDFSDDFTVQRQDIIALDITQTEMNGGTEYAGGYVLLDGSDVGLDQNDENIDAFTIHASTPNTPPVIGANQLTLNEGQTLILDSSNLNASDTETSDPTQLAFTVSSVTGGHFALFVDQATPIFTFTKAQVDAGDIVFVDDGDEVPPSYEVTVSDGVLTDGPEPATINFTNFNDEPVISGPVTATTNEDAAGFNVNLLDNATDPDGDTLNAVGVTKFGPGDDGGITVSGNQLVVDPSYYKYLSNGETIVINYTYTVEDGNGGSQPQTATVSIDGRNDAPTVVGPISQSVSEDDAGFSVDMLGGANDVDTGDSLTITNLSIAGDDRGITRVGDDLVVDPSQYNFLAIGESVTVTYAYDIEDLDGDSVAQTTTIVINGANDNPDPVTPISTSFSEDAASQLIDLLQGSTDPDATDTLSVVSLNLDSGDDRGVTYGVDQLMIDPNAYTDLAPAESETLVYSFQISDGNGGTVSQTATIVITGVNDTPTALDDSDVKVEDNAVTTDVLANDNDVDNGQTLTVTIPVGGEPTNGTAVVNGDNTITYTPNLNYVGGDLIMYQIDDGNGGITTAVLSINVLPDNDPPYVDNPIGLVTVGEDAADTVIDLTTVFHDVDEPVLSYNLVSNSNTGLVNVAFSGTDLVLDYQLDQFGDATIEIQAVDGSGQTVNEVFTVRVDPVNDAPIIFNPATPWNVDEDAANTVIDLTTIFSDVDDIVLSYTFSNDNPALVNATLSGDNLVLEYMDDANGTAHITVEAIDAAGESTTHVIQTNVAPVNDAPSVTNSAYSTSPTEAIVGNAFAGVGDIDSTSYSAVLVSPPANGTLTLNPDGTFVFVPDSAFIGQVSFQFVANDGVDNSTPGEVVIDILAPIVPVTPPVDVTPPDVEDPDPIEPITSTPDVKIEKESNQPEVETQTTILATPVDSSPDQLDIEVATLPSLADLFSGQPDRYYGVTNAEIDLQFDSELMPEASFEVTAYDTMLFASLDTLGDELDEVASNASVVLVTSIVSMSGLSIGVVSWILRSGALLTSLLAQMPAWRLIDPLTVLGYSDDEEETTESVQDIIDGVGSGQNEINEPGEVSATNLA